jgi:superfamily II DNA or RNA helicase
MTQASLFALLPQQAPQAAPELDLRPYQAAARKAVLEAHRSLRGALVVLPTGTGKTRTAGAVIWDYKIAGQKTLVLCPTITLVVQMYNDLRKLGLRPTIEQASNKADRYMADVVVASVATLKGERLKSWSRSEFGLVIADEAHRSISDMYSEIFGWFESAKLLGLTATPIRADGVSLGNVFDTTAYQMAMLDAIRDGWLVPLKFKTAITDFDPKALRTLAGEVDASSVAAEITRSGLLHEAANTLAELANGERTVAFLPTVASSKAFVGELLARGVPAEHVDGTTPEDLRNEVFARFTAGETRVLSNVAVLTEGWDCPAASVIALLSPTKSWARLTQMIGRGTRLAPGKTHALVLDFCPGRMKRGRLASPADALAGRMLDDKVYEQLAREGDLAESIAQAEKTVEELEDRKRKSEKAAREKAARVKELADLAKKRGYTYGVQEHDAEALLGGVGGWDRGYVANDVEGPSEEERRKALKLCSVRQAAILRRAGLNPDLKWWIAKEALDAYFANGKRFPQEVLDNKRYQRKDKMQPADVASMADALLEQLRGKR